MDDPTMMASGEAHGQQSPIRWDHSTALAAVVLAALLGLALIHVSFRVGVSGGVGR